MGPMTYFDSAAELKITRARALQELRTHGHDSTDDIADFYAECGLLEFYLAQDVLFFLGY